jgi:hypothetical protein
MTILYSNGCSFTDWRYIPREQRYPIIIGERQGWSVHDRGLPGSCNSRIIRTTIRDCCELIKNNEPIVALVQLTFTDRYEYPGVATADNRWKYENGDLFESVTPGQYPSEESEVVRSWARSNLLLHNDDAAYLQLFASVIGLAGFFRQHNIWYYIYNGPAQNNIFEPTDLYHYLKQDPGVLDLQTFNMLDLTGRQQHPDAAGMITIADYFCNLLNQR